MPVKSSSKCRNKAGNLEHMFLLIPVFQLQLKGFKSEPSRKFSVWKCELFRISKTWCPVEWTNKINFFKSQKIIILLRIILWFCSEKKKIANEEHGELLGFFLKLSFSIFQSYSTINWLKNEVTSSYPMFKFCLSVTQVCDQTLVI